MKRKQRQCVSLILACMMLGGCNFFPEPVSLIQAPGNPKFVDETSDHYLEIVKRHLPTGTALHVPDEPVGSDSIIQADFNNDGKIEIIAFYKSNLRADQTGAFVLQKQDKKWTEVANFEGPGYEVSWGSAEDLTGDGRPELLIAWKMGVSAGSVLDIYSWENQRFKKIAQQKFHELDLLIGVNHPSLAIWQREMEDVYTVDVLKWEEDSFKPDKDLTPVYFRQVAHYYRQRTKEVPDAAFYWYYLADAYLKADKPEDAQLALDQGMQQSITTPSWNDFELLQNKIEAALTERKNADVLYYEPLADLTMNIPKDLYPYISIEPKEGEANEYVMNVYFTDGKKKGLLFAIEAHAQEFIMREEFPLQVVAENEQLVYGIRRNSVKENLGEMYHHAAAVVDEMIASIRLGSPFSKYNVLENELLIKKVQEAYEKYVYVGMGGKMESGVIENFTVDDMDYRYLGADLDMMEKLNDYLAPSFTKEAIRSFMESARIIEHEGRMAQPNADGGSLLNYSRATVLKVKNLGTEVQYDLSVPLGNSLVFETVTVVLKKTAEGWRISSNPITL
ncbi:DL-endopeptidase inhibitor IseA family protein [Bacillus sp. JJ1122]|uniref:DL-endopeptidase inhibitor IseA family protein n=1 Tax=Bacillus sp. JJ1122 TaxID=3122951 RepID=UPI003000DE7C